MFTSPCTPRPRPLLHSPQITTVCALGPIHFAQTHNPTILPMYYHRSPLSLRRHHRLSGTTPFYPLRSATRQTIRLISYWTPHHRSTFHPPLPNPGFPVEVVKGQFPPPLRFP